MLGFKKKIISLTAVLFTAAQRKKQPRGPLTDEWISRRWSVHTMIQYLVGELRSHKPRGTVKKKKKLKRKKRSLSVLPIERKDIFTYATTWMSSEDSVLSEISQSQKDRYYTIPFIRDT